jgi:hypothetical protein
VGWWRGRAVFSVRFKALVLCGLNDAVRPVFIKDGDMKGLSEGLRQQVDEGECARPLACASVWREGGNRDCFV